MNAIDSLNSKIGEMKQEAMTDKIVGEVVSKYQEQIDMLDKFIKSDISTHHINIEPWRHGIGLDKDHSTAKSEISDFLARENMELMKQYNKMIDLFSKGVLGDSQEKIKSALIKGNHEIVFEVGQAINYGMQDKIDLTADKLDEIRQMFLTEDKTLIDQINKKIAWAVQNKLEEPIPGEMDSWVETVLQHVDLQLEEHIFNDHETDSPPVAHAEVA